MTAKVKEKPARTDKKTRRTAWLLAIGFGVTMGLPFLIPHIGFLSLVGFLPLFLLDRLLREKKVRHAFWYYYVAFLAFNVLTTFWIWFVSPVGAVSALLLNALQMAAVLAIGRWGGRIIRQRVHDPLAADALSLLFFIITWLAWEHIYFDIELSWPWLCLGNAFLYSTRLVQWYEVFGAVGGSAWILLCNAAIYLTLGASTRTRRRWYTATATLLVFIPILCSEIRYITYQESDDPMEVVVIQPNIDPFSKYGVIPQSALDQRLVELMEREVTPRTRFVVTPETFTFNVNSDLPESSSSIRAYQAFLAAHPGTELLLGALTYRTYESASKPTRSARDRGNGQWIDLFNTAMVLDSAQVYGQYYKSKLVPGVEIIPYENAIPFLGRIVKQFGGSSSSYGTQDEMEAIPSGDGTKVGAMICYELVYGDWSRLATKKGAGFLAVMTNDGWWGDTPGYRQHFHYARLRAIENRRDVVQAANTGISGIINQRGDILQRTGWWTETTIKANINRNDAMTPFVRHGDLVGRWACRCFLTLLFALLLLAAMSALDKRSARDRSAAGNA